MKIYDPYDHGQWIDGFESSDFKNSEIVVLPGGSDVHPSYYNHLPIVNCYHDKLSDKKEYELIQKSIETKKFLVAICKGSQFLTAVSGGWLIQHVAHPHKHDVITHDGKVLPTNSLHHQMSYPYELDTKDYEVLAWTPQLSRVHITQGEQSVKFAEISLDGNGKFKEPEVIYYPKIRGLAIQPHPEGYSSPKEFNDWLNKEIIRLYK